MEKSRKTLLILGLSYAAYSIASGLYGMFIENAQNRVVIVICFVALMSLIGFLFYKVAKRKS